MLLPLNFILLLKTSKRIPAFPMNFTDRHNKLYFKGHEACALIPYNIRI